MRCIHLPPCGSAAIVLQASRSPNIYAESTKNIPRAFTTQHGALCTTSRARGLRMRCYCLDIRKKQRERAIVAAATTGEFVRPRLRFQSSGAFGSEQTKYGNRRPLYTEFVCCSHRQPCPHRADHAIEIRRRKTPCAPSVQSFSRSSSPLQPSHKEPSTLGESTREGPCRILQWERASPSLTPVTGMELTCAQLVRWGRTVGAAPARTGHTQTASGSFFALTLDASGEIKA
ncbi:MAG: hypothetical protein ACI835_003188 [Planctomycetota bacterium]